jgi:hypothetical protein
MPEIDTEQNIAKDHKERKTNAFIVAPSIVPLIWLPQLILGHVALVWSLTITCIVAVFSYGGVYAFGWPAYGFLRKHGYTNAWIAVVIGFASGFLVWQIFCVVFPLSLDEGGLEIRKAFAHWELWSDLLYPGGLGSIVGIILWLIARPDRP